MAYASDKDFLSYRDAFNQLGSIVFKGTWDYKELKNASLYYDNTECYLDLGKGIHSDNNFLNEEWGEVNREYDNALSYGEVIHGYLSKIIAKICKDAMSVQEAVKETQDYSLTKEVNEAVKSIQYKTEDTKKIEVKVQELDEVLNKWKEVKLEYLKVLKRSVDNNVNLDIQILKYAIEMLPLEKKSNEIITSVNVNFLYMAKFIMRCEDYTYDAYKNIFDEKYTLNDLGKSFDEYYTKYKYFINFFKSINKGETFGNWETGRGGVLRGLMRYAYISQLFYSPKNVAKCYLYNRTGDIREGGFLKDSVELNLLYSSETCYKRAGFILGQELDCKKQRYIKQSDFKPMFNEWLPDGKIGRIEGYLRKELGYYPPWLEVQIRAIAHFKKTPSTEKTQINDVINWLKKDNELLQLIKLKKEQLSTKHDDMKALTKFLHHEITRKES